MTAPLSRDLLHTEHMAKVWDILVYRFLSLWSQEIFTYHYNEIVMQIVMTYGPINHLILQLHLTLNQFNDSLEPFLHHTKTPLHFIQCQCCNVICIVFYER